MKILKKEGICTGITQLKCFLIFFLDLKQDTMCLKTSHPYYHQIQGQLHICNKTFCDLIVWTRVDCIVIRIVKDIEWTANVPKLIDFYINIFIPALMEN